MNIFDWFRGLLTPFYSHKDTDESVEILREVMGEKDRHHVDREYERINFTFDISERTAETLITIFGPPPVPPPPTEIRFIFNKVRTGGEIIEGDITKMKKEFGFSTRVEAVPVGPAGSDYQHGSAVYSIQAQDSDGNDRSADYALTVDPANELAVDIQHSGTTESTALLTLRADGDPDADETAEAVGTLDFTVDAPNVTAFTLSEVTPTV